MRKPVAKPEENGALSTDEVRDLADLVATNIDRPDDETAADPAWDAIGKLHLKGGGNALDLARAWQHGSPNERRTAAWILGQLGYSDRPFAEERFSILAAMLASEMRAAADPAVLNDICVAFGHLHDARAVPLVLPLTKHQSGAVRFGVVFALSGYEDVDAIAGLIALSHDNDANVRDWATFGLGSQTDADTPELREALIARLRDREGDTDQEAVIGLARRGDLRVVPRVLEALDAGELSAPLLEAAALLALPEFCPSLLAIQSDKLVFHIDKQRIDLTVYWREATAACGCGKVQN